MPSNLLKAPRPQTASTPSGGPPGALRRNLGNPSLLLFVILTAQLMVVLDTTIVNVALPHIQQSLGFSSSGLSWVLNIYILTFGGLLLLGARAGDLLGRRRVFLTGIALFTLSSLVGGIATTGWMLLAARAVQGIGAALAAPSALSLLTTAFAEGPARVRAIGLYTTVSAAGGATGLVAGGLLTDLVSWRWVMFVNVPIGLVVWMLGRLVIAETAAYRGRFDVAGAVTSTLGMTGIVFGLVEAGSNGWGSPRTIASLVVGIALLGIFVHHESRVEEPILPLRLLTHATRSSANVARGLLYAGMYGMFFFLSQFFQDVQRFSALVAGVAFLPMPTSVFLASQLTGRVLVRRFPQKMVMMAGATVVTLGLLLATRIQPGTGYGQIVVSMVLTGAGMGISFVSLTSASLAEVAPDDAGAASGLVNVSQQLGGALGLAVLVTAFDAVTSHAQLGVRHLAGTGSLAHGNAILVHGLDFVFGLGALFSLAALAMIAFGVRPARQPVEAMISECDDPDEATLLLEEVG
ncbi:MAG: MFS transporter [Acidimicrobiales bacterium]|nr:MFS transporter [Acidimicrobiales bacterium]